jgi:hypothetical protein
MAIQASWFCEEARIIQQQPSTICWAWSIRPLVIWLRVIGVDFSVLSISSIRRWLILVYRAFCFLLHFSCQINNLHFGYNTLLVEEHNHFGSTTTSTWNTFIDFINYFVHGVGIHIMLLTVIRTRWINMMDIFQRLHDIFTEENYIRIRKLSYWGIIYVILVVRILSVIVNTF